MNMPVNLWLVRHARPLVAEGVCYGALDVDADAAGSVHAANRLAAVVPSGAGLVVSGLRRARRLAEDLVRLRPDLSLRTDARLNEMDFGRWEGWPWARIPREALEAWSADFPGYRFGGRESAQQVIGRVAAALADTCRIACQAAGSGNAPGDVVWITHAGVIRAATHLIDCPGKPLESASQWPSEAPAWGEWRVVQVAVPAAGATGRGPRRLRQGRILFSQG